MVNLTKKLTASLLLAAMLLSAAACSKADDKNTDATTTAAPTDTTVGETEEPKILPDLPDIKFDDRDFRFYQYNIGEDYPDFQDLWVEEADADPIHDAVYKRNSLIEETYEVKIVFKTDEYVAFETAIRDNCLANESFAEVIVPMGHCIPRLYGSNVFYNLHDIEYLDFEKPWWNQDAVESFTLAGYLPFAISDLTINDKSVTSAVYFNKKLADDYKVEMDFYQLVDDGKWTMDTMIQAAKMTIDDLDGNQTMDDADRYGIVTSDEPVYMLFHASGGRYVSKDSDGYPYYSFESEANYTAISYYLENIMFDSQMTRNNTYVPDAKGCNDMFADDQGLFLFGFLGTSQALREMDSDFGIIPIPKYQESQEGYACSSSVFEGSLIGVPIITTDTEFVGVILEALSAESKYQLIPAFYETVLKDKTTRDEASVRMLDIIIGSMVFDVGDYYNLAGFSDRFLRITGSVYDNNVDKSYPQRTSDVSSFYARYEKQIGKEIEKLIEVIDKWNEMAAQ